MTQSSAFPPYFSRLHEGFPWGVAVGHIHQPGSGDILPAIWPTSPGGVWVDYSDSNEALASQWLEYAALDLLSALPARAALITVFDFGIRKRFTTLAQLQAQKSYRVFADLAEAQKGLEEFERIARHRHHQLLDEETPTMVDFNRRASRPEPFHLLLINLDDFPKDPGTAHRLTLLLQEAIPAGIYLLAYGRHEISSSPDEAASQSGHSSAYWPDSKATNQFKDFLGARYPHLLFCSREGADGTKTGEIRVLGGEGSQGIARALTQPTLYISAPTPLLLQSLATLRERHVASDATASIQDFLSVPVGDTLDGKQCIEWRMGQRSGCLGAMIIGLPRMGKSTLLNNLLVGIAESYTANQIRLFLMDYKEGVEFQRFDQHPNVERIFLDNEDTQAAIDMLSEFRATIAHRGGVFRQHNAHFVKGQTYVSNIDEYNANYPECPLPRLLLVIDEFQCLLNESNPSAARVSELLLDVIKRGPAAGVHMILATQSLMGLYNIGRLLALVNLRVSFKVNSQADVETVMEMGNYEPLALRPHDFVINSDSGKKAANVLAKGRQLRGDVAERMVEIRSARSADECVIPVVVSSSKIAKAVAAPLDGATVALGTGSQSTSPSSVSQKTDADDPGNEETSVIWEEINGFLAQALQANILNESDLQ